MYLESNSVSLKVISYWIIFFPSLDVVSSYPLSVLTMFNNLYTVLRGRDSSQAPKTWTSSILFILLRGVTALVPILVAMGVSNLVIILKYAGLLAFTTAFFLPAVLQIRSQWVCKSTFFRFGWEITGDPVMIPQEGLTIQSHLIPKNKKALTSSRQLYMTPYSTLFSHWPAVIVIASVCVVLFVVTTVGLFL